MPSPNSLVYAVWSRDTISAPHRFLSLALASIYRASTWLSKSHYMITHCNHRAAIPLKPTAAVNPGISSTSFSVPLDWTAKTPTVPTIALSE
jgi:hypothetical protein